MLLASAPVREWSLLSSRPTSRAHDRSLYQGNPTEREAGLDMHLTLRCMSRSVPHFHAQFTQYIKVLTTTAHLQSIETLICWPRPSIYKMSNWINAGHQSKVATAQCRPCARKDVQRNRRRTRTCITCLPSSGSMLDANATWCKVLAWPRRSHYQPGTPNTHLMAQKTWPIANHRAARAQWWSTEARPTGCQRLININKLATYLEEIISRQYQVNDGRRLAL